MSRGMTRADRVQEMERLYLQRAYSDKEMAERLSTPDHEVDRTTVFRDRRELERRIPFSQDENGRYLIDRVRYLPNIRVNLCEALSLYLAARRASQQTHSAQKHTASALEKLALTLKQPMTQRLVKAADIILQQKASPGRDKVFEIVADGWVRGLRLRVEYQGLHGKEPYGDTISPYLIEPSPWSDSVYVIGPSDRLGKIVPYKLDRIQRAVLTSEPFILPADFDEQELLRHAWGIWRGEGEPVAVKLKFAPGEAARRVQESVWHPLERVTPSEDGGCLWEAPIAEWREMVPWVRQWGSQVEALEPAELREAIEKEVRRLIALYQVAELPKPPLYQLLWAKAERKTGRMHPLFCHMLDVAQVTLALWRDVLTDSLHDQFAKALCLDAEATGRLLAFWAALHDLGKASPAFQRQVKPLETNLIAAGLPFPKLFSPEFSPHSTISALVLEETLQAETQLELRPAKRIALALGGHHGAWPPPGATDRLKADQVGGQEWDTVRRELVLTLIEVLEPPTLPTWITNRTDENVFLTLFSGLTSVADWIGSAESYFPYAEPPLDPRRYAERSAAQARQALADLGWTGYRPPTEARRFEALFPFPPNPMQQAMVELVEKLNGPALVLIEAQTGLGKTEAALYLADHKAYNEQQAGLYVAMPTMATSNQMYGRVAKVLRTRYGSDISKPLLVHSQARWLADTPPPNVTTDDEQAGASTRAMTWFLPRKRSLLAPFGVGTVDQSLISVLQTRHFFVRLFGLSHKTIIFDEVHAYDTYMSTLFQRLLAWLRAVGASVVLLSATLPAQTRRELVQAYAGGGIDVSDAIYPAITWAANGQVGTVPLPLSESRVVALKWISRDPATTVTQLREALREGGCAAVICNTVARSQGVYQAVRDAGLVAPGDLILFHARTPFAWRDMNEKEVLNRFGKDSERPQKAIVVATQVIEQSLDLDFDVIISDLAPVDLLLQRAGRLHRHSRPPRPTPVGAPRLLVAVDEGEVFPDFGNDAYVYEPYVLLRSLLALQGRDRLTLPQETAGLIEAVYGDAALTGLSPVWEAKLAEAQQKMARSDDKDVFEARKRLVPLPSDQGLLAGLNADLEEDAPAVNAAFQALTRLGDPSIALVCLHASGADLYTEPDGSGRAVALNQKPDGELTGHLAQHTVSLTHRGVFEYYLKQEVPSGWREHPLLRDHRVAIFTDGLCPLPGTKYTLRLGRELGLEITKD